MTPSKRSEQNDPHPPAWILEGLAFEAQVTSDRPNAADKRHAETCELCRSAIRRLRIERAKFVAEHDEASFFTRVKKRNAATKQGGLLERLRTALQENRLWLPASSLAAAVAAWLVFVMPSTSPTEDPVRPEIRMRGDTRPILHLFVSRGGTMAEPLKSGCALHAGDLVRFGVTLWEPGYVYIANLDELGRFSLYFPLPGGDEESKVSAQGRLQLLPGSIELDDFVGREAIYLIVSNEPITMDALERAFALPDEGARMLRLPDEIDLPAQVVRWIVLKESPH